MSSEMVVMLKTSYKDIGVNSSERAVFLFKFGGVVMINNLVLGVLQRL